MLTTVGGKKQAHDMRAERGVERAAEEGGEETTRLRGGCVTIPLPGIDCCFCCI